MALADTANLVVRIGLDDKLSGGLGRISGQLKGLDAAANQVGRGVRQVGQGAFKVLERGAIVAAGAIGYAVKSAGDFEASLNTINTIVKLPADQLKTLGEGIRSTFTATGVPIDELTSAYYDLLSAGVKVSDAQSVLNTSVKLGIGGLATTKESVDLLTTAMNSYGLNADGAAKASDIFAAAVRDGKVTVSDLAGSFADVAPLAAQTGVKLEEIGAAYATLTARGVPAAEVGVQFNRALIELLKPGPALVKILKGLGESSFEASIKQKGLVGTLADVRKEAERQGIPFQDLFGRLEAYKFALATTGPNAAAFTDELAAMGASAGEANAQFAEREQGLNFQLGKLKAAAQDAGITIGTALIPKLVPLIEKLNAFIQDHQADIASFGQALADGIASFADKLGTIDFSGVIGGLKILRDIGKGVVDIFLSLPKNVQGMLIAGLAVNKLSGGLIGQGIGNIAGGVTKGAINLLFERGNTPVRPLYTYNVNGGGGVGGLGGAAGAAGAAGGLGIGAIVAGFSAALVADLAFGQIAAEINKKLNPTSFNYNEVAGQSRDFSNPQAADQFARSLAKELHMPLDDVKRGIVFSVQQQGLTFDQAVERMRNTVKEQTPVLTSEFSKSRASSDALYSLAVQQASRASADEANRRASAQQIVDATRAAEVTTREKQARIIELLAPLPGGIASIVAKKWSFQLSTVINASFSVTQALAKITQAASIRYDGKTIPI